MASVELDIEINAPPEQVFRYVTDLKRHPEWSSNEMQMEVQGEPVGVGTTFSTTVKAFGKETTKGKVVEFQAPSRFAYECDTSSSGFWRWTMDLQPTANGTRLTHRAEALKMPLFFKIIQPIAYPLIGKKMGATGLANIKRNVEAGGGKE